MKSLKLFVFISLFLGTCLFSRGSTETTVTSAIDFKSLFDLFQKGKSVRCVDVLDSFYVVTDDSSAGDTAEYELHFQLTVRTFCSLNRGGFSFSFPVGFDLTLIEEVTVSDDCSLMDYAVDYKDVSDNLLTIFLKRRHHGRSPPDSIDDKCNKVRVEVSLKVVGNPIKANRYQLAGLAFDRRHRIVAGPNFSEEFSIIPGLLYVIDVSPAEEITLCAGDLCTFSAVGVDRFGNVIDGLEFQWTLAEGSDAIGVFSGPVLQARHVGTGWAEAMSSGVSGQSGRIMVIPGELARMVLNVSSDQIVGQPLLQAVSITLYDSYSNLKTDYDLSENPITLVPSGGRLVPDVIDNQDLLTEGVIELLPVGITYFGPSAVIDISATNGEVTSPAFDVSFNGYDILAVSDAEGNPVYQVFSGQDNTLSVVVQNNGLTKPSVPPVVKVNLKSGSGSAEESFAPNSDGVIDTILITLPVSQQAPSKDTLVVGLGAEFTIGGQTLSSSGFAWVLPVRIVAPYRFEVVENSFLPDTVYPGDPFSILFIVSAEGFEGPIDSTHLVIALEPQLEDGGEVVIYEGSPAFSSFEDGVISYRGLEAVVNPQAGLQPGWHTVKLDYSLFSSGHQFGLVDNYPDSIYVLPELQASYVVNSFGPTTVFAGAETAFHFDVNLANDFPFKIVKESTRFTVYGSDFSVSTNLTYSGDSLWPGNNSFETEKIFIPVSQLGKTLRLSAMLSLIVPGLGNLVIFNTSFENQTVLVAEQPVVQIIEVDIVAPNAPRVNTAQRFQIRCRLANLSATPLSPLELGLRSDGSSVFDSTLTLLSTDPYDTVEVFFDVTASQQPNAGEVFWVDILSTEIGQLPPVDNFALVIIERPAELEFLYSLLGVENGLVNRGDDFNLTVELHNLGEAAVSPGTYMLTTGGVDFGFGDTTTGAMPVDTQINFTFRAPSYDTTATFVFSLIDIPLDLNTNNTAIMNETSFEFSIRVESLQADLLVEPEIIGSNLILPGREKALFRLDLTNCGVSSVTGIRLDEIVVFFRNPNNSLLDAHSMTDPESAGFYEDGVPISVTSFINGELLATFDDFIIQPRQTRSIEFIARLKETIPPSFVLDLERHGVLAVFLEGPNAGGPVEISSSIGGEFLIHQVYAVKGGTLEKSFEVENNPFHPDVSAALFSYELSEPSAVEFRVFTLTGEEVFSRDLPKGSGGTAVGENEISWDGRNDAGRKIKSGVYIVSIRIVGTDEQARIKVAVVK